MAEKYDIAVLGGGPGGYVAAIRAAQMGAKVACIEEDKLGGICLNWGCIPTKTFIATAHLYRKIQDAAEFGIDIAGTPQINLAKMVERKNKVVNELVSGIGFLFKSYGVTTYNGFGYFDAKNKLAVDMQDGTTKVIEADKIIVATGSRPMNIPAFPFNGNTIVSSDELIYPKSIPATMTIIGGGVIGCEFACLLAQLGTKVNVVEMLPNLLPLEDVDSSKMIERELKKHGAEIFTGEKSTFRGRDSGRCCLQTPVGQSADFGKSAGSDRAVIQYRRHQRRCSET
ncbi:MAG: FAD-dependent oxidoreductase [bacterium]|nr:FAD-dependent oxidoreductase [bacterium]